jgi:broad specificity phosphatase PhoE
MTTLYLLRHAESTANAQGILAGRHDFPLSETGLADARELAADFAKRFSIDAIWCSPLTRAQQTATPFATACHTPIRTDKRLTEQDMGRFSGLTYPEAEGDPGYQTDRKARWNWQPEGGGESYQQIAQRVAEWLDDLRKTCEREHLQQVLVVTHAVTLRLFRACLENTLPSYPEKIAGNGELWVAELPPANTATKVSSIALGKGPKEHRA